MLTVFTEASISRIPRQTCTVEHSNCVCAGCLSVTVVCHFRAFVNWRQNTFYTSFIRREQSYFNSDMARNASHFAANWPTSRSNEYRQKKIQKKKAQDNTQLSSLASFRLVSTDCVMLWFSFFPCHHEVTLNVEIFPIRFKPLRHVLFSSRIPSIPTIATTKELIEAPYNYSFYFSHLPYSYHTHTQCSWPQHNTVRANQAPSFSIDSSHLQDAIYHRCYRRSWEFHKQNLTFALTG